MADTPPVGEFLDDRPDLEEPLEQILRVDDGRDSWEFDDVPVDTGAFGELVSEGIVESAGEGYRLADPDDVRTALEGDESDDGRETETETETSRPDWNLTASLESVSEQFGSLTEGTDASLGKFGSLLWAILARPLVLAVFGALFVGLVRASVLGDVVVDGRHILAGNDPYFYRHWVEQLLVGDAYQQLSSLPSPIEVGEPLMIVSLAALSALAGGDPTAAGAVLTWYPVASAILTALGVYALTRWATGSRWASLAAVLVFAFVPQHAVRTMAGFADHHAFDYVWLVLTAVLLHHLIDGVDARDSWLRYAALATGFGLAVAGQLLAWDAGVLLIGPIGVVAAALAVWGVRTDRSLLDPGLPVVHGLSLAAFFLLGAHFAFGWQDTTVVASLFLLLAGVGFVLGTGEAVRRSTGRTTHLIAVWALSFLILLPALRFGAPGLFGAFVSNVADRFLRFGDSIFETQSLVTFGIVRALGLSLLPALPVLVWRVYDRRDALDWVVVTTYAWFFLVLSLVQVRFAGELAPFLSIFAGYGIVWLTKRAIEAVNRRTQVVASIAESFPALGSLPSARVAVVAVVLLVPVLTAGATATTEIMNSTTYKNDAYETAVFLANHSAETDTDESDTYALSPWSRTRLYNYFASGKSASYNYSQKTYTLFQLTTEARESYDSIRRDADYIVLRHRLFFPNVTNAPETNLGLRLAKSGGSMTDTWPGTGHYRLLYFAPNNTRSVYEPVEGAVLTGPAPPNATVIVATNVSVPNAEFDYFRRTESSADGEFSLRVSYPGLYLVQIANGTRTVAVAENDLSNGTRVLVSSG